MGFLHTGEKCIFTHKKVMFYKIIFHFVKAIRHFIALVNVSTNLITLSLKYIKSLTQENTSISHAPLRIIQFHRNIVLCGKDII